MTDDEVKAVNLWFSFVLLVALISGATSIAYRFGWSSAYWEIVGLLLILTLTLGVYEHLRPRLQNDPMPDGEEV
jgi:hypothetical protein